MFKVDNDILAGLVAQFVECASDQGSLRGPELIDIMRHSTSSSSLVFQTLLKRGSYFQSHRRRFGAFQC